MLSHSAASNRAFQSTLPRRERLIYWDKRRNYKYFNPRSREGSDLDPYTFICVYYIFQSTLPRRERRLARRRSAGQHDISIHAPAKGATAKITKTIPNDFGKINNYNNSFA